MREVSQYVSEPTVSVPVGMMVMYAGGTVPAGWLICQGATLLIADYPALYSVLSTTYGGNGTTNFLLPNLAGRVPVGAGGTATGALTGANGAGVGITEAGLGRAIGSTGGYSSVTLTSAQSGLPSHTHSYNDYYRLYGTALTAGTYWLNSNSQSELARYTGDASASDASSSHENRMPYLVLNFIIRAY
jgi:microcystin-dependent protein